MDRLVSIQLKLTHPYDERKDPKEETAAALKSSAVKREYSADEIAADLP